MKRYRALLCLSLLSLVGCGTSTPSSSDSITSSSNPPVISTESSSSSEDGPREAITAKEVFSQLKKLAKATSYHLVSGIGSSNFYEEWLSNAYYYNTSLGYGYLLKESFDPQYGSSIVYSFSLENNEVKLSSPKYSFPGGKLTYVNDLSSLRVFSAYEDYQDKIDSSSFGVDEKGDAYSENKYVIRLFAAALGYTDDESLKQISRVYFYRQNGEFGFALQKNTIFGFYLDIGETYSRIGDLGTASHPVLDAYCSAHYAIGKQALQETNLANFDSSSSTVALHSEAHVLIDGEDQGVNLASELLLTDQKAERIQINPVTEERQSDLIVRHNDGYAYEVGYDETGKVTEKLYQRYLDWNDLVPNLKQKLLEEKGAFRLEDGQYVYYGRVANRLKDFLGQMDIRGTAERLALTVDANGQVNGAVCEFALSHFVDEESKTSFVYRYRLETTLIPAEPFTVLNDLTDDKKIPELDQAISYFDGTKPYSISFRDSLSSSDSEVITYADNVYVDEKMANTTAGVQTSGQGYYQKGSDVQSFLYTKEGSYFAKATSQKGSIQEYSPHSLNSVLFQKKGDTYTLRDHTLSYVSRGLPLNYNASLCYPRSWTMKLDPQGRIGQIQYTYDWDVANDRTETARFTYEGVSLPKDMKATLNSLADFKMPISWTDEDPEIASNFEKLYGEEAKNIPYVYSPSTYKQWTSSYSVSEIVQLYNSTTEEVDSNFYELYRQALLKAGFVKAEEPTLPGAEEYNLGKIKVRLAKILRGGFYFTLNN